MFYSNESDNIALPFRVGVQPHDDSVLLKVDNFPTPTKPKLEIVLESVHPIGILKGEGPHAWSGIEQLKHKSIVTMETKHRKNCLDGHFPKIFPTA